MGGGGQDFFRSSAASPCLRTHCGCTCALLVEVGSFVPSDILEGTSRGSCLVSGREFVRQSILGAVSAPSRCLVEAVHSVAES